MNVLKNQILEEVAQLDINSLLALQPILQLLKKKTVSISPQKRGVAAAQCRQTLSCLPGSLSQTIIKEREDRL